MFLFFDTETTGLPKAWNAPLNDLDNWPRLVQLAWLAVDENGQEISARNYIIKPEDFDIPMQAAAVHGISTQRAHLEGVDLAQVLLEFSEGINPAKAVVAHNISFDEKIVGAEFLRKNITHGFFNKPKICTMQLSTDYCALPPYNGRPGFKFPRLTELHHCLFNEDFAGAHDAMADVRATVRCFFELRRRGIA